MMTNQFYNLYGKAKDLEEPKQFWNKTKLEDLYYPDFKTYMANWFSTKVQSLFSGEGIVFSTNSTEHLHAIKQTSAYTSHHIQKLKMIYRSKRKTIKFLEKKNKREEYLYDWYQKQKLWGKKKTW